MDGAKTLWEKFMGSGPTGRKTQECEEDWHRRPLEIKRLPRVWLI
jgi:hypothetical protein